MIWKKGLAFLAVLVCIATPAFAGEEAVAPTATGETGLFTLLSGTSLPQGEWSFGLYYNNWDRVFERNTRADLDWSRLSASVGYGVTDRFEVSLMLPYEDFEADFPGQPDVTDDGLGNARLGAKWLLGGEGSGFALNAFVELPTGDEEVLGGETGFGAGANWDRGNWVFNIGARVPGDIDDIDLSPEIIAGLGYAGQVSDRLDWITELVGTLPTDSDDAIFEESVDLTTGLRLWLGDGNDWAFNFGVRTDLLQLSETDEHCPIGGLLGLTYLPRFLKSEPAVEPPQPPAPPPPPQDPPKVETPPPPPPVTTAPSPPKVTEEACKFASNSARVDNRCKATLDEVALRLKDAASAETLVIGYTDSTGSDASNQRMSERRAQAVKDYLVTRHGIDGSRIEVEGRGSADPVGDNATAAGREQNRRAVIRITIDG
ncbi:MAG: OmpA family protein [Acidobacteriota bacterium]